MMQSSQIIITWSSTILKNWTHLSFRNDMCRQFDNCKVSFPNCFLQVVVSNSYEGIHFVIIPPRHFRLELFRDWLAAVVGRNSPFRRPGRYSKFPSTHEGDETICAQFIDYD